MLLPGSGCACRPTSHTGDPGVRVLPQLDCCTLPSAARGKARPLFRTTSDFTDDLSPWHDNLPSAETMPELRDSSTVCRCMLSDVRGTERNDAGWCKGAACRLRKDASLTDPTGAPYSPNWKRRRPALVLLFLNTGIEANVASTLGNVNENVAAVLWQFLRFRKVINTSLFSSKSAQQWKRENCYTWNASEMLPGGRSGALASRQSAGCG